MVRITLEATDYQGDTRMSTIEDDSYNQDIDLDDLFDYFILPLLRSATYGIHDVEIIKRGSRQD